MTDVTVTAPRRAFSARASVPGDKSLAHRALIFAAMARGPSDISGLPAGRDIESTLSALRACGVDVEGRHARSPGVGEWRAPAGAIDAGNSATTLRLLAGALAARPYRTTLTGDASLRRRPMDRLVGPLRALGAAVEVAPEGTPPVTVGAATPLRGADVELPVASAQVRTAFALAALQAEGPSVIDSPPGFRDHTERWLGAFGLGEATSETAFRIDPGPVPAMHYAIPGDASSAAFLWTAAALRPGAQVTVDRVTLNPGRTGFLDVLTSMGADVATEPEGDIHGDPFGRVTVRGRPLHGVTVAGDLTARAIDELPLVGLLGGVAEGITQIEDAAELRAKESDRIRATVAMLTAIGGKARETADGLEVIGSGGYRGGRVDAVADHRIAMAAAVAAVASEDPVTITDFDAAANSWPGFLSALEAVCSSP
ncbi:MAG: 3-phosphoshikimate 1-carboxyvinyltransferase [Acidimicrobiia bacterium]